MDELRCQSRVFELSELEARGGAVGCLSHNSEAFERFCSDVPVQHSNKTVFPALALALWGNHTHAMVQWLIAPPRLVTEP